MNDSVNIPGYRVLRPLGVGGMASVYLAVQESLDREVALKVMAPALVASAEFTDRFLKEGRITARLSHPNLVTVFDIGQHGSIYYIAAEYIPGGTLRERMDAGLSIAEGLDAVRDVAQGLHYAQEQGFVHRDVKPGNILFKTNGTAVLADFGIAKSVDSKTMATQIGSAIGTPHYMSPEQARAEKVDGRSDLYSLGAVLFEVLTGKLPYDAGDPFTIALMHVTHAVPQLPAPLQWLQPLIEGLMVKNADDRFPTGEAFIAACDKLLSTAPEAKVLQDTQQTRRRAAPRLSNTDRQRGVEGAAKTGPGKDAPASPSRRPPMPVLIGAAVGALLVVVGGWALFGRQPAAPVTVTPGTATVVPTTAPTITATPLVQPSPAATPVALDTLEVDLNNVDSVNAKAREYVRIGILQQGRHMASPEGDCAIDLFRRALELDPGNVEAQVGLGQIADYFESKARATYDRGFFSGSMILAENGLRANPNSESLKKLLAESRKAAGLN